MDHGQSFLVPTGNNGTRPRQSDNCCSGLCDFAQHYIKMLQGQTTKNFQMKRATITEISGAWRQGQVLTDLDSSERGNNATVAAMRQRLYLKHGLTDMVTGAVVGLAKDGD